MERVDEDIHKVSELLCNCCGRSITRDNDIMKEDVFTGVKEWGYFSNRDMEVHKFNICEKCYEEIIGSFKVPVHVFNKTEVL